MLRDLIGGEIENLPDATTIAVDGPAVTLPAELAVSVGLVLHELCTNAIKHGCFSCEGGRLQITWHLQESLGNRLLHLSWIETCARSVSPKGKSGFGTRLIERSLAKLGSGYLQMLENGLHFRMQLRLPQPAEARSAVA